jgi:hypothetical protein
MPNLNFAEAFPNLYFIAKCDSHVTTVSIPADIHNADTYLLGAGW